MQLYHLMPVMLSNMVTLRAATGDECGTIKQIHCLYNNGQ